MKPLCKVFVPHRAKSGLFSDYLRGEVAYVGNSLACNAVVGYVKPLPEDRVFNFRAIVVSAFCEATVQIPPFVACGRAGNGLVVLEPRSPLSVGQLAFYASYINQCVRWRFNWYRQVTLGRLKNVAIPDSAPSGLTLPVSSFLPATNRSAPKDWILKGKPFQLGEMFEMVPGSYHVLADLRKGTVPVVSCGEGENGIAGYYDVPGPYERDRLTVALNGSPLLSKYHPYDFAAKDDVAVLIPKEELRLTTLLFIQVVLNCERWRYSYYRKCYIAKLQRFQIHLPSARDEIDEDTMEKVLTSAPYWDFIERRLGRVPNSSIN